MAEKARSRWVYAGEIGKNPGPGVVENVTAAFFRRYGPRVTFSPGSPIPDPNPEMVSYLGLPGMLLYRIEEERESLFLRDVTPLGPSEHQSQGAINFLGENVYVDDQKVEDYVTSLCCRAGVIRRK